MLRRVVLRWGEMPQFVRLLVKESRGVRSTSLLELWISKGR